MNMFLVILTAMLLFVLARMTEISIKRKESRVMVAWSGGVTGACVMLLLHLIMIG